MKKDILRFVVSLGVITAFSACGTEGVKLEPNDRPLIDTLIKKELALMAKKMDQWCVDSTPIIRQRMIDSLVILREQEIRQKISEIPNNNSYSQ